MPVYVDIEPKYYRWKFIESLKPVLYFVLTIIGIGILKKVTK